MRMTLGKSVVKNQPVEGKIGGTNDIHPVEHRRIVRIGRCDRDIVGKGDVEPRFAVQRQRPILPPLQKDRLAPLGIRQGGVKVGQVGNSNR